LSSKALNRILEDPRAKKGLEELRFIKIAFNEELAQTVWQASVIPQLKTLIFESCSLEDSDIKLMPSATLPSL
jgi:hypothetical protein